MSQRTLLASVSAAATLTLLAAAPAQAVFFHIGSGSIDGSLCVGNDCVSSESFGFDTVRLKENNLRLHFDDTSVAASFPRNDWRLTANDSSNGGASYFGVEDATAGRFVFRVFAGARSNALTVDSQGDVGLGTTTPALDIDIKTGDTPSVRLQQDGTSGFTPQTWDMAGNEAGFFIRDATSGSTLPFRIITGGAPSESLVIDADGDIGSGTGTAADASLEIRRTNGTARILVDEDSGTTSNTRIQLTLENNGSAQLALVDSNNSADWRVQNLNDAFRVTKAGTGSAEMELDASGNLTILGGLVTTGGGGACTVGDPCDAVFDPALYTVPSIEEHAAAMWQKKHLPAVGPTGPGQPINMTEKMLRMLNELEHAHIYIEELNTELKEQHAHFTAEIAALKAQLAAE